MPLRNSDDIQRGAGILIPTSTCMAKHSRHTVLSDTATHDKKSGDLRAVIETPKGSRNKYRYDPDCDCFSLATTLPDGMAFPFDFGFIPSTLIRRQGGQFVPDVGPRPPRADMLPLIVRAHGLPRGLTP